MKTAWVRLRFKPGELAAPGVGRDCGYLSVQTAAALRTWRWESFTPNRETQQ